MNVCVSVSSDASTPDDDMAGMANIKVGLFSEVPVHSTYNK